jgi:DnaK suppressor protein
MERVELEEVRSHLIEMILVIAQTAVQREVETEEPPGAGGTSRPDAARELRGQKIESDFQKMQCIREALQRIEDGTYGRCLFCDRQIQAQRLKAKPWALCCAECEEAAERDNRKPAEEWCLPGRVKQLV